ncbi:DNA-directed DNA polymerase, partial [Tanacetum coccineum]
MSLKLADRSIQYQRGIVKNVLIEVDKFVLPIDFVIMDIPEDSRILIILGTPFLATAHAMIDVFNKKVTLRVGDDEVIFDMDQSIQKPPTEDDECYCIDDLDDTINIETQEFVNEIDVKEPELKDLPSHLEYAYLHGNKSFPIIISSKLSEEEKISLLEIADELPEKHLMLLKSKFNDDEP